MDDIAPCVEVCKWDTFSLPMDNTEEVCQYDSVTCRLQQEIGEYLYVSYYVCTPSTEESLFQRLKISSVLSA